MRIIKNLALLFFDLVVGLWREALSDTSRGHILSCLIGTELGSLFAQSKHSPVTNNSVCSNSTTTRTVIKFCRTLRIYNILRHTLVITLYNDKLIITSSRNRHYRSRPSHPSLYKKVSTGKQIFSQYHLFTSREFLGPRSAAFFGF